ncbi:MAG: YfiR/HmsC family protein, partial [Rhizomicrobium sp.]|nr:YfiR/HmsC family protein [Rhizomicrobium sp.]
LVKGKVNTVSGTGKTAKARAGIGAVLIGALLSLFCPAAAAEVTPADLQAAMRALGFLTALQNRPSIAVGVVYHDADSKLQAVRVAAMLMRQGGPGSATVAASVMAVQDLPSAQHVDALYLLSLPPESGRSVAEFVKRQSVVSISADPACLDEQACVLMVQARSNMTIVLDTALAQAAGAKFSAVFTMLVKRR